MFKSLKEKLSNALSSFSKEVEENSQEVEEEIQVEEKQVEKKEVEVKQEEEIVEENPVKEDLVKKEGFLSKVKKSITNITLSEEKFEEIFWELEITLIENNVAQEVIELIKQDLKEVLVNQSIGRSLVDQTIKDSLTQSLEKALNQDPIDLFPQKKPFVILVIGVNGSGKTTTLAKLANLYKKKGKSVVIAAADTFRAAAIQQVEEHSKKLGIKLIKHDYKSDPSAVGFDAIKHAKSKDLDVVLIDTAGRLHSNDNLMQELKKLERVCNPDLKIFVGESITGNDCVEQARIYNEKIGIDAIILTKLDVDEKGGAAISSSYITKKPIIYYGNGQEYDDLQEFDKEKILQNIL